MSPLAGPSLSALLVAVGLLLGARPARAQDMNLALPRLSTEPGCTSCAPDVDAWRSLMSQLGVGLITPLLTPAATGGPRGVHLAFDTSYSGISHLQPFWRRGVEGNQAGALEAQRVDSILTWGRLSVRKGLPFGLELGGSLGYQIRTSHVAVGGEVRWAILEGSREDALGWVPDLAVRGAVQALVGGSGFRMVAPSAELILSKPLLRGSVVQLSPFAAAQWAHLVTNSGTVDLTPGTSSFETCDPDPSTPVVGGPSPPACRGDDTDLANNVIFPRLRSSRWRAILGAELRYRIFALAATFSIDVLEPSAADGSLPADLPRQWRVTVGASASL